MCRFHSIELGAGSSLIVATSLNLFSENFFFTA
jgi:hypothetical protein